MQHRGNLRRARDWLVHYPGGLAKIGGIFVVFSKYMFWVDLGEFFPGSGWLAAARMFWVDLG